MNLHGLGFLLPKESSAGGQKRQGQHTTWLGASGPGNSQWGDHVAGWRQCGATPKVGEKMQTGNGEALMQMLNRQIV